MIDRTKHRTHNGHESMIDIDPELRAFIIAILPFGTFTEIADECRSVFGPERAPTKSTIHRWFSRQRALQRGEAAQDAPTRHHKRRRPPIAANKRP